MAHIHTKRSERSTSETKLPCNSSSVPLTNYETMKKAYIHSPATQFFVEYAHILCLLFWVFSVSILLLLFFLFISVWSAVAILFLIFRPNLHMLCASSSEVQFSFYGTLVAIVFVWQSACLYVCSVKQACVNGIVFFLSAVFNSADIWFEMHTAARWACSGQCIDLVGYFIYFVNFFAPFEESFCFKRARVHTHEQLLHLYLTICIFCAFFLYIHDNYFVRFLPSPRGILCVYIMVNVVT